MNIQRIGACVCVEKYVEQIMVKYSLYRQSIGKSNAQVLTEIAQASAGVQPIGKVLASANTFILKGSTRIFFNFIFFKNMFIDADHTQDLRPTRCVHRMSKSIGWTQLIK